MFEFKKGLVAVLLLILVILFIWYGSASPEPEKGHYPGSEHIIKDHETYVGELVEVGGKVVDTDPLTIEVEYGDESLLLEVTDTDETAELGDRVSVFGTLEDDNTVRAEKIIVRPRRNWYYMYGVSGIAAVWLLIRIISYWEYTAKGFKPREEPMNILRRDDHG
ncbi:MAG: hypothetical protein ACOC53_00295 [Candidatus Saliniplasma sp.]